jgi:hypothetical protein
MLYAPCPFYAPFLFCVFQLLHTTSFYTHESLSTTALISSLFYILLVSVHLVHAICTMLLHALHRATVLLIGLFTATPLFLYFARSILHLTSIYSSSLLISEFYLTLCIQFNSTFFIQNNQLCIVISYLLLFTHASATELPTVQEP